MKWVSVRPFRLYPCWPLSLVIRESGVLILLSCPPQSLWIGKWNSRDGAQASKSWPTLVLRRRGRSSAMGGAKRTRSIFASLLTNWSSRIILLSEEKSGTTWFLMRRKILRTSKVRDGRPYFVSIPSVDSFLQEHHCKTTWWSFGPWCTSLCPKSSQTCKISKTGSRTLSAKVWIKIKVLT